MHKLPTTVYPRVCGGTVGSNPFKVDHPGLSPRVRGNLGGYRPAGAFCGSIPACAGEAPGLAGLDCLLEVYPRVCGGTLQTDEGAECVMGLSPRVRGNLSVAAWASWLWGSIPACAGEPSRWTLRVGRFRVYPRVCGGTGRVSMEPESLVGLSPRVRGNLPDAIGVI